MAQYTYLISIGDKTTGCGICGEDTARLLLVERTGGLGKLLNKTSITSVCDTCAPKVGLDPATVQSLDYFLADISSPQPATTPLPDNCVWITMAEWARIAQAQQPEKYSPDNDYVIKRLRGAMKRMGWDKQGRARKELGQWLVNLDTAKQYLKEKEGKWVTMT